MYDCTPHFVYFANKFTGKERDAESGNDYFGARYYGSSTGRWLSPDPSGQYFANPENPQTWDLYAYVANSPLINVDPFGLWTWALGTATPSRHPLLLEEKLIFRGTIHSP